MTLHAVEAVKMKMESINELKNVEKFSVDSSFQRFSIHCCVESPSRFEISTDCMRGIELFQPSSAYSSDVESIIEVGSWKLLK